MASVVESKAAPSLTRVVYERLRADVLDGRWRPGQKLLMHRLRERYDSGASPLREALSRLTNEGLAVHHDQRGFVVAAASVEALADIVRTRITVESILLDQRAAQRDKPGEEALVLAFHRLSSTPRSIRAESYVENPEWERLHRAFHFALLNGRDSSPLLLAFCAQLYDQAYRYRQLAAASAHKRRTELDEHRALFDAVLAGRFDDAKSLMAGHYARTAELFIRASSSLISAAPIANATDRLTTKG